MQQADDNEQSQTAVILALGEPRESYEAEQYTYDANKRHARTRVSALA